MLVAVAVELTLSYLVVAVLVVMAVAVLAELGGLVQG